jgi:hypothetical protein
MVIDLNRILLYADAEGNLHDRRMRHVLNIVDGIVGGEGNGPLDSTPKPAGLVAAGISTVAVDMVCAQAMGFDYRRMPLLQQSLANHPLPIGSFSEEDVIVRPNSPASSRPLAELDGSGFAFEPHFGWKGHIELQVMSPGWDRGSACVG